MNKFKKKERLSETKQDKFAVKDIVFKISKFLKRENVRKILSYIAAFLTIIGFGWYIIWRQPGPFKISTFNDYQSLIKEGFVNTILISAASLIGSLILGFIFYLLSVLKLKYFNALIDLFTEIIYGTPLLVLIIVMQYVIQPAFGGTDIVVSGFLALTIYMSPYMMNVYKSAISSISEEQYMAMDLFGFTPYQRYRYIIIPQVIRILMPPMMNNFSMIIKGSALLNVLAFTELFYAIRVATSKTFEFMEGYLLLWILYLIITIPLSQLTKSIERKWSL